jgi:hypothetical protein
MRTHDISFQRVLSAPNWRARFYEAAANASAALVEYSARHEDAVLAEQWMGRLHHFRQKAQMCRNCESPRGVSYNESVSSSESTL